MTTAHRKSVKLPRKFPLTIRRPSAKSAVPVLILSPRKMTAALALPFFQPVTVMIMFDLIAHADPGNSLLEFLPSASRHIQSAEIPLPIMLNVISLPILRSSLLRDKLLLQLAVRQPPPRRPPRRQELPRQQSWIRRQ